MEYTYDEGPLPFPDPIDRASRTILTGDLNKKSQVALVKEYAGATQEFQCDVAKAACE